MNKVWVIMGNDFPDAAFDNEVSANKYIEAKKEEDRQTARLVQGTRPKVYWRAYEFEVQS